MARTVLAAASIALLSLFALAPTAQAATSATIVIQTAPPPVHYEATPGARRGMVWVQGHWEWRHDRYRWIDGHWIKARPGYRYSTPQWSERGGRWHMEPGRWDRDGDGIPDRRDRDRDGDGVPNRYDRTPDGRQPHYNAPQHRPSHNRGATPSRHDRDRDGDGVPNRKDRRPDNPYRN